MDHSRVGSSPSMAAKVQPSYRRLTLVRQHRTIPSPDHALKNIRGSTARLRFVVQVEFHEMGGLTQGGKSRLDYG